MQKKPTYHLSTFLNGEILRVVVTGEISKDNIKELANEVYDIVKLTNARKLLCDIREMQGRLGFTDVYLFLTNVPSLFFDIYTAFVDIPENAKLQPFRQFVARNTGLPAQWYTDADDAVFWLQSISKQAVS
ncbi:MAG: hypothetical protein ABSC11_14305 [Smithella sp.]|jgi:hypothetical protein